MYAFICDFTKCLQYEQHFIVYLCTTLKLHGLAAVSNRTLDRDAFSLLCHSSWLSLLTILMFFVVVKHTKVELQGSPVQKLMVGMFLHFWQLIYASFV